MCELVGCGLCFSCPCYAEILFVVILPSDSDSTHQCSVVLLCWCIWVVGFCVPVTMCSILVVSLCCRCVVVVLLRHCWFQRRSCEAVGCSPYRLSLLSLPTVSLLSPQTVSLLSPQTVSLLSLQTVSLLSLQTVSLLSLQTVSLFSPQTFSLLSLQTVSPHRLSRSSPYRLSPYRLSLCSPHRLSLCSPYRLSLSLLADVIIRPMLELLPASPRPTERS